MRIDRRSQLWHSAAMRLWMPAGCL